jgi:hypothetical protein
MRWQVVKSFVAEIGEKKKRRRLLGSSMMATEEGEQQHRSLKEYRLLGCMWAKT